VLSADWSYPCVPLVEGVSDPRNLASIVLYAALVAAVLAARPAALARQAAAAAAAALLPPPPPRPAMQAAAAAAAAAADMSRDCWSAVSTARWVLMLLVGLILAPFFPASNVLFYVGTYIGERLLYLPSVGACLLAAHCLRGLLMPLLSGSGDGSCSRQQARGATGTGTSTSTSTTSATISSCAARAWACVRLCLLVCLLLAAAGRTLHRNVDWWDDERLFMSALGVCPNSAKVQLNVGMLARRRLDFDAALTHFRCVCRHRSPASGPCGACRHDASGGTNMTHT
jgi:protein O-mannosyl-transferase